MRNTKTILTTVVVTAITIISLFLAGAFFISKQIEKEIRTLQVANFRLQNAGVKTNLFLGEIKLSDVELRDTISAGTIDIPEIAITGIGWLKFVMNGKVSVNQIHIKRPTIALTDNMKSRESPNEAEKPRSVDIGKVEISNATVLYQSGEKKRDTIFSSRINLDVWEISTAGQNKFQLEGGSFDRLRLVMEQGEIHFSDQLYRARFNDFQYDSDTARLAVAQIKVLTKGSKYGIGNNAGVETDWFDFVADGFEMKNIRLNTLLSGTALILDECRLQSLKGTAFKDKRLPLPEKPNTKLPMELLDDLPFAFHCSRVTIAQGSIRYEERADGSNTAGYINFERLQAEIKNLGNIDSLISGPTTMTAKTLAMGKSVLQADFVFPNKKFQKAYQAKGTLAPVPLDMFNPMIIENAGMKIEGGELKSLAFNFDYNAQHASGEVIFEYDQLKVSVLKKGNQSKNKFQSFVTNTFIVRKENLREKNNFRKGEISFERNKKRSVFNYWWKSLYSGLKDTAAF